MIEFSLILPVHNEEDIIRGVVNEVDHTLKKMGVSYEIILVENGSSDNSYSVIKLISEKKRHILAIVAPKGYGSAVIAGVKKAKGKYVCYMPSDGQVDLSKLRILWNLINTNKFQLVKIKRVTRENIGRLFVSKAFSILLKLAFNTPIVDINGSPRMLKKSDFNMLELNAHDSFIDAELLIKISYLRWKIKEIPMKNIDRYGGISTRNIHTYIEFLNNIIKYKNDKRLLRWKNKQIR